MIGYQGCSIDNAYLWRDEHGKLDCGLLDWGGFCINNMARNLARKLWNAISCSPFEMIKDHIDTLLSVLLL